MKSTFLHLISAGLFLLSNALLALPAGSQSLSRQVHSARIVSGSEETRMTGKADVDMPEAVTFLNLAGEEMAKYHRAHEKYAAQWYRLGFDYAYPAYRLSDPGLRATPTDKNRWKPRGSHFTYILVTAGRDTFLIKALDSQGKPVYELKQGMRYPKLTGDPTSRPKSGK